MKKDIRILIYSLVVFGAFLMLTNSCKKDDDNSNPLSSGTVKDIDGNVYHTVTIGTQVWMVENLYTTKYRNGDLIPNVIESEPWETTTTGAYCNYDNDAAIGAKHGKLYNGYAVSDSRNIAPNGWHVATKADWEALDKYVAINLGNSGSKAKALASNSDWPSSTEIGTVGNDLTKNNSSGFTALPGGFRTDSRPYVEGHNTQNGYKYFYYKDGSLFAFGMDNAFWWCSSADFIFRFGSYSNETHFENEYPNYSSHADGSSIITMNCGFSVRCVKD